MSSPLWARELRGAQSRWWRQPWAAPWAVVGVAMLQMGAFPESWLGGRLVGGCLLWHWAEPILCTWILWVVIAAMTRDRQIGVDEQLALTLLDGSEISIPKTFAPAFGPVAALAAIRLLALATRPDLSIPQIGLWPGQLGGPAAPLARSLGLIVHLLIHPVGLAMIAGWAGAHSRSPVVAWFVALAGSIAWTLLLGSPGLLNQLALALIFGFAVADLALLSESTFVAGCIALGLWSLHGRIEVASGLRLSVPGLLGQILMPMCAGLTFLFGLDSTAALGALVICGTLFGLKALHAWAPLDQAAPQSVAVVQITVGGVFALRWLGWSGRRFARSYFAPGLWNPSAPRPLSPRR